MSLAVGDVAPDFELRGADGATGELSTWKLSDLSGHRVVLAFYPADNSPVCTAQLEAYTDEVGSFQRLDATVLAISPQSPESHRDFAAGRGGFGFPLLSDEDKEVARAYGAVGMLGLYRRCTFVIDRLGRVQWLHRYVGPGLGYKSVEDIVAAVESAD